MTHSSSQIWTLRLIAALLVIAALIALTRPGEADEFASLSELTGKAFGPAAFEDALARADRDVRQSAERQVLQSDGWLASESHAMALHRRAQLTADFSDLSKSYALLKAARSNAPDGSGPALSSAVVSFALHRQAEAAAHLDRRDGLAVRASKIEQAEVLSLRGDLALYSGDYDRAKSNFRRALALDSGVSSVIRLANYYQRMGEREAALRVLAAGASQDVTPRIASLYLLYAGGVELKRGRWDEARDYFEKAEEIFPGYWLASAHIAQLDGAQGNPAAGEIRYRQILKKHEEPSVMSAYAALLSSQGRDVEAKALEARALAIFNERAREFPEAYADHLLDAAIGRGDGTAALKYARANHANRPYGDAKVGVARALVAAGRPQEAIEMLDHVEASGWRSTEQYMARADACEALDRGKCARAARRDAERFNPKALDPGSDLLAFGNH